MKKILVLIVCCIFCMSYDSEAWAYTVFDTSTGEIVETDQLPQVHRTVETLTNGTKVTYEFPGILLIPDDIVTGAYRPVIDGFGSVEVENEAWVPIKIDHINIDDTTNCTVQMVENDYIMADFEISPARYLEMQNSRQTLSMAMKN